MPQFFFEKPITGHILITVNAPSEEKARARAERVELDENDFSGCAQEDGVGEVYGFLHPTGPVKRVPK